MVEGCCRSIVPLIENLREGALVEVADVDWVVRVGMPLFVRAMCVFLVGFECLEVIRMGNYRRKEHLKHVGDVQSDVRPSGRLVVWDEFLLQEAGHVDHDGRPLILGDVLRWLLDESVLLLDSDAATVVLEVKRILRD